MENLNCENKNIEGKFLRDMRKSKFLKVENSLRIRKKFYRLED